MVVLFGWGAVVIVVDVFANEGGVFVGAACVFVCLWVVGAYAVVG